MDIGRKRDEKTACETRDEIGASRYCSGSRGITKLLMHLIRELTKKDEIEL